MTSQNLRPEDRRRGSPAERGLSAETAPDCFRSEAFAEDLPRPKVPNPDLRSTGWRAPRQRSDATLIGLKAPSILGLLGV
jgi:hypothetical protein